MTLTCPKGHSSTESDFCSECGAKISNGTAPAPSELQAGQASETCPDCHFKRAPDAGKFCELCGYNFETGAHGEIPTVPTSPPPPPDPAPAPAKWTLLITIDPALKESASPDPPPDWSPVSVALERDTLLIGRTSQSRAINPEIALDFDSAVSHRHAVLTRADAGGWTIRDIGSSNGTRLNGRDLQAMTDVPVNPGDRITLGHWTCLAVSREPEV